MAGYAIIWRKIFSNSYHKNHLLFTMMVYFITHAEWRDRRVILDGKKSIDLKRGQIITNERKLAQFFEVGRRRIRTAQAFMKKIDFATQETTQGITILTICNYDQYQIQKQPADPRNDQEATQDPTHVPYKTRKKEKVPKRKCVWPSDFVLTDDMKKYAIENKIHFAKVDSFFEDFKDWAIAKGATYVDWKAAFRTRVRKAPEYGKQYLVPGATDNGEPAYKPLGRTR